MVGEDWIGLAKRIPGLLKPKKAKTGKKKPGKVYQNFLWERNWGRKELDVSRFGE